jgi:hypothetical protein
MTGSEGVEDRDRGERSQAGRAGRRAKRKVVTIVVVWRSNGTVAHWEWFRCDGSRTRYGQHLCARRVAELTRQFHSPDYAVIAERIIVQGPVDHDLAAHPRCPGSPGHDVTGDRTGGRLHAYSTKAGCSDQAIPKNLPDWLVPCVSSEVPRFDVLSRVAADAALGRAQTQGPLLTVDVRGRLARLAARRRSGGTEYGGKGGTR